MLRPADSLPAVPICPGEITFPRTFFVVPHVPPSCALNSYAPRSCAQLMPHSGRTAVADNTLTIKQKSILPIRKTRQDKSLFRSLSGAYPPPLESGLCHICSAATSPSWTSAAPAPLLSATGFRLRPSSVLHDDLRCCHRQV